MKGTSLKTILEVLEFPLVASIELTKGWWEQILRWVRDASGLLRSLSLWQILFLLSSILTLTVALFPWIQYHINLVGPETVPVGSNLKLFFVLPGLLGILFLVVDVPGRKWILYGLSLLAAILYGLGFIYPIPIHTRMKLRSDFQFVKTLYLYGPLLLSFVLLTARGTQKTLFRLFSHLREETSPDPLRRL